MSPSCRWLEGHCVSLPAHMLANLCAGYTLCMLGHGNMAALDNNPRVNPRARQGRQWRGSAGGSCGPTAWWDAGCAACPTRTACVLGSPAAFWDGGCAAFRWSEAQLGWVCVAYLVRWHDSGCNMAGRGLVNQRDAAWSFAGCVRAYDLQHPARFVFQTYGLLQEPCAQPLASHSPCCMRPSPACDLLPSVHHAAAATCQWWCVGWCCRCWWWRCGTPPPRDQLLGDYGAALWLPQGLFQALGAPP